jgi:hypothetical protein
MWGMETGHRTFPAALHDLAAMAALLEQLERQPRKAAGAVPRGGATREQNVEDAEPGAALNALLAVHRPRPRSTRTSTTRMRLSPLDSATAAERLRGSSDRGCRCGWLADARQRPRGRMIAECRVPLRRKASTTIAVTGGFARAVPLVMHSRLRVSVALIVRRRRH